uniref:Secreted protein n=1 Tax=Arundo donax TaxID=35708 RepID=A0A0A9GZ59_ARUDO
MRGVVANLGFLISLVSAGRFDGPILRYLRCYLLSYNGKLDFFVSKILVEVTALLCMATADAKLGFPCIGTCKRELLCKVL